MIPLTCDNIDITCDNNTITCDAVEYEPHTPGNAVYPDPSDVRAGVQYGPSNEYTGTMTSGGASLLYIISTQ